LLPALAKGEVMTVYAAPLTDMRFVLHNVADFDAVRALPSFADVTADLVDAILQEAGRFGSEVLAPLNFPGDQEGAIFANGVVRMPKGFDDAYRQFVDAGWNGMAFESEYGGQNLPCLVATAVAEVWHAANMAFGLAPMLTQAAAELMVVHASDELKAKYLPHLVSGHWTGTMNLTEPQAGSDLARVRTRAVPDGDGYRIFGQKLYITYGEHDLTENIIHMVLARTPDAPPGVKGLSLFLVPKVLVRDDGGLGPRNDLRCVSIEHKLGIKASPTAVMSFGDGDGAVGYLIGTENRGLEHMFLMMNNARLAVGLEGVGIAERAYQQARAYAFDRTQGRRIASDDPDAVAIVHHPDVQRMLMSMKASTEAARALCYFVAGELDLANHHQEAATRQRCDALVGLLTPVVKAWGSEIGIAVADEGIQVHGGMGYIEESGAPQYLRDARIAAIYEGTNGIQALDLVVRKVARDRGTAAEAFIGRMRGLDRELARVDDLASVRADLRDGVDDLEVATRWVVETFPSDPAAVAAGAVYYLRLLGTVAGGWLLAKSALTARRHLETGDGDPAYLRGKIVTARFFADHYLKRTGGLRRSLCDAGTALKGLEPAMLL
jgi:alkylation response protein AidB-like acyl-CoA dehydrogenase